MVSSITRLAGLLLLVTQVLLPFLGQAQNLTQADFTGLVVPQYMSSGTAARVPVAFRATVANLTPNTLYRYYTQGAISTDLGGGNSGAGNPLIITPGTTPAATTYIYTSSAGTNTAGGYATFTTNAAGTYTGWFAFLNTGNARFTAGNAVYPTIVLATDAAPATVVKRLALDQTITVLALGTDAVGLKGNSSATAKNLVAVYSNEAGTGRPLGVTVVEAIGATGASFTGIPAYYTSAAGDWNTLIPSALPTGVRRVEQRSVVDGTIVGCASDADGVWPSGVNTVNPTAATTALTLTATDAPLNTNACGTASTAPTIASFTPATATVGATVTITGTNLTGATALTLNGAAISGFTVVNGTTITFTVPTGATSGAIAVTTPGGTATSSTSFTVSTPTAAPTVTSFSPASANVGATVTITGTNLTGATAVTLNGVAITGYNVVNGTTITFVVPTGATSGAIAVTTPGGTATSGTSFTVTTPTAAPTITAIAPATGAVGATVTVTGTNLTGATGLTLNGVAVSGYTVVNGTTITFVVPAGATTGAIAVTTPGGTATSSTSFTVSTPTAAPTITSFSPATAAVGATVTITGTDLTGATAVTLNGVAITGYTVVNGTTITFVVPTGATSGTIAVTTPGGTATSSTSFTVSTPSTGNFFEDFEIGTKPSYTAGVATLRTGDWTFDNAVLGALANDKFFGAQGARIRGGGFIAMNFDKPNGAGTITINAAMYGSETGASFTLDISTNGGTSYTPVAGTPATLTATLTPYTFTVNQAGNIRLRIGTTNTTVGQNPRINIDDITITDAAAPTTATLTATPANLPAFNTVVGTASASQSFAITGVVLTADATITAPAGYEVSLTAAGPYAASVTVPQTSGTIASTTVYVRLTGAAVGNPAGNVTVASTGATTQNVAVTGTVTATAPAAPTITSFTPTTGAAGATVTITGTNLTGASAVTLNGVAITNFTVVNGTTITFVLPATAATGTIAVTTPGGTATSTGTFTVTPAAAVPTITSFSPARAITGVGFTLTVNGTNLVAGTVINFNGVDYTGTVLGSSGTGYSVVIPASGVPAPGTYPITATNAGGTSASLSFLVVAPATTTAYEDFEQGTKTGYAAGVANLRSGPWTFTDALLGNLFNDKVNQVQSARIRGGSIAMNFDKPNGAGVITLQAAMYGNDTPAASLVVEISTNGGTTYSALTGTPAGPLTTTLTTYTYTANVTGNVRLRFSSSNTTVGSNPRINIDDLNIADYQGTATLPGRALPGLALYPNPAHDRLTVTLPTAGAATVALRDLTGRVVLAEAPLAANGVVALPASLATGTYLLEVRQNGVTAVRRVAKN
jgi:hypothetical protein